MKCHNPNCRKDIPIKRKKTAKHCSNECTYEMKKQRGIAKYAQMKKSFNEIKRNEQILSLLYQMHLLGKSINGNDLGNLGFNFGISTGEYKIEKKYITKVVGEYAYCLDPSYNLKIWKLNIPR